MMEHDVREHTPPPEITALLKSTELRDTARVLAVDTYIQPHSSAMLPFADAPWLSVTEDDWFARTPPPYTPATLQSIELLDAMRVVENLRHNPPPSLPATLLSTEEPSVNCIDEESVPNAPPPSRAAWLPVIELLETAQTTCIQIKPSTFIVCAVAADRRAVSHHATAEQMATCSIARCRIIDNGATVNQNGVTPSGSIERTPVAAAFATWCGLQNMLTFMRRSDTFLYSIMAPPALEKQLRKVLLEMFAEALYSRCAPPAVDAVPAEQFRNSTECIVTVT
jgi:hypothetical protein